MDRRQSSGWQFSTLFLVKDSLAVMLESAHLYEDALREYSELEACYLEALAAGSPLSQQPFGQLLACTYLKQLLQVMMVMLCSHHPSQSLHACCGRAGMEESAAVRTVKLKMCSWFQPAHSSDAVRLWPKQFTLPAKHSQAYGQALWVAGGNGQGNDVAQLLSATWRDTRHAVLESGMVPQFQFRQFLFACQARLLVKLNRHIEVRFHVSRWACSWMCHALPKGSLETFRC